MTLPRTPVELPSGLRRRRFTAPHRRRSLTRRLLRPFALASALVAMPLGVLAWLLAGPQFRLREIEVAGTRRVPAAWVEQRIEPLRGSHLLRLSLADIQPGLASHPWIAGVAIQKRLPDALTVRVSERRPAALLRGDDGLHYVDADGHPIDHFDPADGPLDLPLVRLAPGSESGIAAAVAASREFARVAPAWGRELSEVEVLSDQDLRFHTAALPFALLLGASGIEAGLRRLRRHLPEILPRFGGAAALDLRFSGRIVVIPAAEPLAEEG